MNASLDRAPLLLQVSTDEVYGARLPDDPPTPEGAPYAPTNPYSATKAGADHLVRAWHHTYGLPAIITACSNNYGPRQYPEKLLPLMLQRALAGQLLPVYGDGLQRREWLHVRDHVRGLRRVLEAGTPGETYHFAGESECTNLEIVGALCAALDRHQPRSDGQPYALQIQQVADRPGHDRRYALDGARTARALGWRPQIPLAQGLEELVSGRRPATPASLA